MVSKHRCSSNAGHTPSIEVLLGLGIGVDTQRATCAGCSLPIRRNWSMQRDRFGHYVPAGNWSGWYVDAPVINEEPELL